MAKECNYLSCTSKTISTLYELKPGDHIRVRGELGESLDTFSSDLKIYTHHMLVVEVLNRHEISVIHKTARGVEEEKRPYGPDDITVVEYDSAYSGETAVLRARERKQQCYNLVFSNCEHFVTEVRTGEKQSIQVRTAVKWGMIGAAIFAGAVVGGGLWYASSRRNKNTDSDSDSDNESDHQHAQYA